MQLGMVGLGRMGAGIVRRLMRDGHTLRRLRRVPGRGQGARGGRCDRLVVARGVRREAREAARGLGHGSGGRHHGQDDRRARRGARGRRHDHRRRQHALRRGHPARERAARERHPPRRRRHERRRLGLRARLLPDDRRRDRGRRPALPHLRVDRTWGRLRAAHAGPDGRAEPGRVRLLPLRPERRGALREDGAQRHRVRAHGRVRRRA